MRRVSLALAAALALPFAPASAADATAHFGALDLAYSDDGWTVEDNAIHCIAENCFGAIIDVTVTRASEFCTRDYGYAVLLEAFPDAETVAVNVHALGNLSLVFAQSGPPLRDDIGRAAFACVSRDGLRHEFRSVVGDAPIPPFQDSAIFELLRDGLSAEPRGERILSFKSATILYDGDVFEVASQTDAPHGATALVTCLPPFCQEPAVLIASVRPVEDGECFNDPNEVGFGYGDRYLSEVEGRDGATILIEDIPSMCRAMSPSMLTACVEHDGMRYVVGTAVDLGCYHGPYVPEELFVQFVRGIGFEE